MGKFFIILFCMFLFISCEHCYNCVADGQHAENWLPYIDNQFVTLSSSDNSSKVFKVKKKKTDPSKESCDFVFSSDSDPRMECDGYGECVLTDTTFSQNPDIFSVRYSYDDAKLNRHSSILLTFNKLYLSLANDGTVKYSPQHVTILNTCHIGTKDYSSVYKCWNDTSSLIKAKIIFYYQKENGLLKIENVDSTGFKSWELQK